MILNESFKKEMLSESFFFVSFFVDFFFDIFFFSRVMTRIKEVNVEIAEFIGPDPDSLAALGDFSADFKEDVADLFEKATVHVAKMRVMKELLEMANGSAPMLSPELEEFVFGCKWKMSSIEKRKVDRFYVNLNLWEMVSRQSWE